MLIKYKIKLSGILGCIKKEARTWVTSWTNLFFHLYSPLGRTLWEHQCSFQNIRKTWKPGDYQQMLDICWRKQLKEVCLITQRKLKNDLVHSLRTFYGRAGGFSNLVCNQINWKFVKISRPLPRDPDFNREESNQCSPPHPHETGTNGALATHFEKCWVLLSKVRQKL